MAKFFMMGRYSSESVKGISAGRTKKAVEAIEANGGKVDSMYALLGENDLVLIVDLPDMQNAIKASLALNKMTGIAFSTYPALSVEEFDKLIS